MPPKGNGKRGGKGPKKPGGRPPRGGATGNNAQGDSSNTPNTTAPPPKIGTGRNTYHDFGTGRFTDVERHRHAILSDMQRKELAVMGDEEKMREHIQNKIRLQGELKNATGRKANAITKEIRLADNYLHGKRQAYDEWKTAVALYEDFLYYQNPRHRQHFLKMTHKAPTKPDLDLAKKIGKIPPVVFSSSEGYNLIMEPYVRGMRRSRVGVASRLEKKATHQELHLRTPVWRRQPLGVGRPLERLRETPLQFELDLKQIEEQRSQVDNKPDDGTRNVTHANHQERRAAQSSNEAIPGFRGDWDRLKTPGGLYISAMEDSDDWPTSYDYTAAVRDSYVAVVDESSELMDIDGENYPEFEFTRSPKRLKTDYEHEATTRWTGHAETGRQEWHKENLLSPASVLDDSIETRDESIDASIPQGAAAGPGGENPLPADDAEDEDLDEDSEDEGSDDEGDLFVLSYIQGCNAETQDEDAMEE